MMRNLRTLVLAALALPLFVAAQTLYIPDTYVRTWLNNAKPGSVDAAGNCDSTAWNAVPPNSVTFQFFSVPDGGTVDLTGIQYLKMNSLTITDGTQSAINVIWAGYPRSNANLILKNIDVNLFSPSFLPLPTSGLGNFQCDACGLTNIPAFNGPFLHFINIDLSAQTIVIPNTLNSLTITNTNISTLPPMPNVAQLTIGNNPLTSWANLPTGLISLSANNVGLTQLPTLNEGLVMLFYSNNGLTSLPALPSSLVTLNVRNNALTSVPALPSSLSSLVISSNPISSLPSMPNSLTSVTADSCAFTNMGTLSTGLTTLNMELNQLSALPTLPNSLTTLNLKNSTLLSCLPILPQNLVTLKLFNTGVNCLPNIPPNLNTTGGQDNLGIAPNYCDITNSPCTTIEPKVIGTVFNDADANGIWDSGESVRPYAIVQAQPGDYLAGSNASGRYVLPVDIGTWSVSGLPSLYEPITTSPYSITFTALGQIDSLNHIGYESVPGIYDLTTDIHGTVVRPGFAASVWITVRNAGTEPTDAFVQFTHDPNMIYGSSSYATNSINGNVLEWNTGLMYPGNSWTVNVSFYTPPAVPLGTPVIQQASSTPDQADLTPADNIAVLNDSVVGSYDPNDKRVIPELLSPQDIVDGKRVNYTVRFQNTGTYPAERVLITDTLSSDLQWATMQEIGSSHDHTWYIHQGVLHVLFENINLPDSTSDEPNSHGFIAFSMVPISSLMVGESVGNIANIYFDFNDPIITNEAVFTVDLTARIDALDRPGLTIWPNPAADHFVIAGDVSGMLQVDVIDVSGRIEDRGNYVVGSMVDIQDLSSGTYVVRITTNGRSINKILVKQ